MNVPASDGVPLMVNTPALKLPVTPVGKPVAPAPVPPPPTEYEMPVIAVLIQRLWAFVLPAEVSEMVAFGLTVIVPVAVV